MNEPITSRLAKIQARLDDQDAMSPTVSEDDIAWLLAIAQAANNALARELNEHSTDYDRAHPWTDEAEGREHLWKICEALNAD